jgi:hypothetical protein
MGPTWKSIVAFVIGLAAICSAHGQPVPFFANVGARACLTLSYSVIPELASHSLRPDDPRITEAGRTSAAMPSDRLGIVAYVAGLELVLAVLAAIACLLALALAGVHVKRQRQPGSGPELLGPIGLRPSKEIASLARSHAGGTPENTPPVPWRDRAIPTTSRAPGDA